MIDVNTLINTCYETTSSSRVIASYSHMIPIVLSLILGIFVFVKARFNLFSKVFLAFIVMFSIWLIGDAIIWTSNDYYLIYAIWSFLDYIEIVSYVLGLYFALVFVKKSDISILWKMVLFALTIPAFLVTSSLKSVDGLDQSVCEAFNNNFLGQYKLIVEVVILFIILVHAVAPLFKKYSLKLVKRADLIVLGSMFLFFSVFGVTEYLASVTGYYEMNLYSLFLLPIFLVAIIYAVFELDIFNFRILGTHYLVIGLVVLMGGQLFFITNATSRLLTILTVMLTAILSIILFRNLKRESDQRIQIAQLNIDLQDLLKQRESLVHLVTHKVKSSFTRSKYIFSGMLDGSFGEISPEVKKRAEQGMESDNMGIETVDLVLNAANLQRGTVKYEMKNIDFKQIVLRTAAEKKISADVKGVELAVDIKEDTYTISGDSFWLKEALNNLVENSVKYTLQGKITVGLTKKEKKIQFFVKDTGVGVSEEDKKNLFTEGGRGKDSVKINVDSTGYGLYSARMIVEAHKGRVWMEPNKEDGKGSIFFIELNAV